MLFWKSQWFWAFRCGIFTGFTGIFRRNGDKAPTMENYNACRVNKTVNKTVEFAFWAHFFGHFFALFGSAFSCYTGLSRFLRIRLETGCLFINLGSDGGKCLMKRSEINAALREMESMLRDYRIALPDFCYFTPEEL